MMDSRINAKSERQVRYQILEDGQYNEGKLYKLRHGWILRLQLSSELVHRQVRVFCNIPVEQGKKFVRTTFYEYAWVYPKDSIQNDDFNRYVEIECYLPGAFRYYFIYADDNSVESLKFQPPKSNDPTDTRGGCDFLVEPHFILARGDKVHANDLQIQTFLTKSLGRLDEWKSRLTVSAQSGYNCIHFTPVQEISNISKSCYSIRNHLKLMQTASGAKNEYTMKDVEKLVDDMFKEWDMFSMCDLVYNHMSNDSEFLVAHPESTFNMQNSPHLRPALVLDRIMYYVTRSIARGEYENQGVRSQPIEGYYMDALRHIIRDQEVPKHKLTQFFEIDLGKTMKEIKRIGFVELENIEKNLTEHKNKKQRVSHEKKEDLWRKLKIVQDPEYRRLMSTVDYDHVLEILKAEFENLNTENDLKNSDENSRLLIAIYERFQNTLNHLNEEIKARIELDITYAVNNVMSHFHYYFLAHDGHKWPRISHPDRPIVSGYFYFPFEDADVKTDEAIAYDESKGKRVQAYNGWVMGDDPLKNFASQGSHVYFRRELIAWSDSIKLRYGQAPQDSQALWDYMGEYTRQTAKIFHAVRLDNCHSTPIHVAQHFLDIAREIRPNILVIAELFTNSEFLDNKFVTQLGITSLVREALNAWNANELGRLVHRFGGEPVGSFFPAGHKPLLETVANAILYDLTHDNNPCLIKKRSVYDALATSSLVLMANCASGSTRGYDELVPEHISVVEETRTYSKLPTEITLDTGIIQGKRLMNQLHFKMAQFGYSQIYVDQFDNDTTVVTRQNPNTHESYILVARTSFYEPNENTSNNLHRPLEIPSSRIASIEAEMYTKKLSNAEFKRSETYINGLTNYGLVLNEKVNVEKSSFIAHIDYNGDRTLVHFKYFPPGAVILFKVELNEQSTETLNTIRNGIGELIYSQIRKNASDKTPYSSEIESALNQLTPDELNILLYRCSQEETSEQINSDVYSLPAPVNSLIYAGLQGFMNILETESLKNNLGHSLYANLREGNWMLDYIRSRLDKYAQVKAADGSRRHLADLAAWLQRLFDSLGKLPRYLIPTYFDLIITNLYTKSLERCFTLMSHNKKNKSLEKFDIFNGSSTVRQLALASFSLCGHLRGSPVPQPIDTGLVLSLSAGLPHFSATYMRNWGRDTFISLRGLLMLTNRFNDAKNLILSYAACLRHGLIPNLLGEGKFARYNCRDSVWWWLKAIREFTELAPNGYEILNSPVFRLYPTDDAEYPSEEEFKKQTDPKNPRVQKLADVIQEALTVHVRGLKFRERNAGPSIDDHMSSEGFNNEIGVDLNTGFVFGGNRFNAGTWMDKMGSSVRAGNNGLPATPRDGSAVELVGLSRYALEFLVRANRDGKYPYDGVQIDSNRKLTWLEWAQKIDANFEKHYWVGQDTNDSPHINKRNIYKDTLKSSLPWTDYQLRPNFLIALTLAPQMFNPEHARLALEQCRLHLVDGPKSIGIKTLDESDYNYCGYYDNSNDSDDKRVAHGYNYHQGPEWLWPVGFYLRAQLAYHSKENPESRSRALTLVKEYLSRLNRCLMNPSNGWKSLPELTNRNGDECHFGCPSQAWSVACVLEVFYDLASY